MKSMPFSAKYHDNTPPTLIEYNMLLSIIHANHTSCKSFMHFQKQNDKVCVHMQKNEQNENSQFTHK